MSAAHVWPRSNDSLINGSLATQAITHDASTSFQFSAFLTSMAGLSLVAYSIEPRLEFTELILPAFGKTFLMY